MATSTSAAATEAEDRLAILDLIGRLALLLRISPRSTT